MQVTFLFAARAGARQPTGPLFDVVLLLHVTCVVLGLGTLVVSGVQGCRLRSAGRSATAVPDALRRYYGVGVNWAGRAIYGIPVFGLVLLGLSRGVFGLQLPWVAAGSGIWALGAVVAEAVLWPAERRIARRLEQSAGVASEQPPSALGREAARAAVVAFGLVALFVVAVVLMVAQP